MAGRDADMYKVTLKSWLYERINENKTKETYKGLRWRDEENLTFELPWVTENDPDWKAYYKLFHDWAMRDGAISEDSQKAKRNFRSALNHSKHFLHLKNQGESLQTGSYKVYKFLTQDEIAREKNSKQRIYSEDSSSSQIGMSPGQLFPDYQSYSNGGIATISTMGKNATGSKLMKSRPQNIPSPHGYLMQQEIDHHFYPQNDLNCSTLPNYPAPNHQATAMVPDGRSMGQVSVATSDMEMSSVNSDTALSLTRHQLINQFGPDLGKCNVKVEYNGRQVSFYECDFASEAGTRVLYDERMTPDASESQGNICLGTVNPEESPGLYKILDNMRRGILFTFDKKKMQIKMKRDCLAHAYYFDIQGEQVGTLRALKRKEDNIVFSYETFFSSVTDAGLLGIESYQESHTNIEVIVGVQPKKDQFLKAVKGVKIIVQPITACRILNKNSPIELGDVRCSIKTNPSITNYEDMQCD